MKTLNLVHPNSGDIEVKIGQFPDGEPTVEVESDLSQFQNEEVMILTRITSPRDLFVLQLVGDILHRWEIKFSIYISYLMSQRMDRVMAFTRPYSLKVVANTINSINATNVALEEPHSDVAINLINNSFSLEPKILAPIEDALLVFPDAGACERYSSYKGHAVIGKKHRDISTGAIQGIEIQNPDLLRELKYNSLVIVDDLVDGGGTLLAIGKQLKDLVGDISINVSVTHAVNAKGLERLINSFDGVYITNSYFDWNMGMVCDNLHVKQVI